MRGMAGYSSVIADKQAAVVGLAAMGRPAIGEEALLVGIGAKAGVRGEDAGGEQSRHDEAGKVEHGVALPFGGLEEARIVRVGLLEGLDQLAGRPRSSPARSSDRGPRRSVALGAELLHGDDRRFEDAGKRAAPAGMGGGDHAGRGIGEEDRPAIGGADADGDARAVGDDGVGLRSLADLPDLVDR